MIRRPPRSTRTDTLFPYTTLFRSGLGQMIGPSFAGFAYEASGSFTLPTLVAAATLVVAFVLTMDWRRGRSRSEEHTSELQSLMRISYAVFCLKKKKKKQKHININLCTQIKQAKHTQHSKLNT